VTDRLDVRLRLDNEVLDVLRATAQALTAIAFALDTGDADQAEIAAKLKPIVERLDKLNTPDPKE
jgi:hypothetical protein